MGELKNYFQEHYRSFRELKLAYPVVSRRAGGVSLGINLSPHKRCNFDCLYCQVDRKDLRDHSYQKVDIEILEMEILYLVNAVETGELFDDPSFSDVFPEHRQWKDIALSGDGEPTAESCFEDVCSLLKRLVEEKKVPKVPLVLITNATMFHKEKVQRGIKQLMSAGGVIWGKLDAGSEVFYQLVDRSDTPFQRVLDNLSWAARQWPLTIQTLFFEGSGGCPTDQDVGDYIQVLEKLKRDGAQISEVQIHTVARPPQNHFAEALPLEWLNEIVAKIEDETGLNARAYGGRVN
jgi:wyosine [tRNA(Phe)-imidazoG37] synthetase (radical SAM superfamily)